MAKHIITSNQYLTLGTSNQHGEFWLSPVAYAYDNKFNFYFISLPTSKHSQNLNTNSHVVFTIFNSQQNFGEGVGLQIEGEAKRINFTQIAPIIKLYLQRDWPFINQKFATYIKGFQKVLKNHSYQAFKITPTKFWMNDPNSEIDVRLEIALR